MEKVQSETGVGAMTPEQILELAHEAGFPRDTIFYRSDQFITFARAVAQRTRDECAEMILRTDLQALPDDWKNPAASFLLAYAESIRSMK